MAKGKTKRRVYRLGPQGLLDTTSERVMAYAGAEVQKVQPHGTPRNGTMRQCYVQTLDGEFVGMVNEASLKATAKTAPVRDRAAEARERRARRTQDMKLGRSRRRT